MAGVSSNQSETGRYEAPHIERRTDIGPMLIGFQLNSANIDNEVQV
jgi:hypothetical protein